jgi:hypothetical protein
MSNYDDGRDSPLNTAVGRDAGGERGAYGGAPQAQYASPQTPPGYGGYQQTPPYGYQQQWVMRPRRVYPIETKPFFLTSEFVGSVLAIAGIAITAASSDAFGAWRAWILITAVVVGYMISRGIAKSGTRSYADDPREHFDLPWGREQQPQGHNGQ